MVSGSQHQGWLAPAAQPRDHSARAGEEAANLTLGHNVSGSHHPRSDRAAARLRCAKGRVRGVAHCEARILPHLSLSPASAAGASTRVCRKIRRTRRKISHSPAVIKMIIHPLLVGAAPVLRPAAGPRPGPTGRASRRANVSSGAAA